MTIKSDVRDALTADIALMAILTGGVYADVAEISLQGTPAAFDTNKEIKPCALVKGGTEIPRGPHRDTVQSPITIYLYQYAGYDQIELALMRIYQLLHEQRIGPKTFQVYFESEISDQRDQALDCSLATARYIAVRTKS